MKRPTGIPHTFLTVAKKSEPGAMSLGGGRFAVPTIDQYVFRKRIVQCIKLINASVL